MVPLAAGIFPLLNVTDLDRSIRFYKGLGLKVKRETEGPMTWATITAGETDLLLVPMGGNPDLSAEDRAWMQGPLGRGVLLTIGVAKAARTYEKATAMGATIDAPLDDNPWGGQSFMVADPDGYVISLSDRFPGEKPARKTAAKAPRKRPARAQPKKAARKAAAKRHTGTKPNPRASAKGAPRPIRQKATAGRRTATTASRGR